jgi:hypothetical protein
VAGSVWSISGRSWFPSLAKKYPEITRSWGLVPRLTLTRVQSYPSRKSLGLLFLKNPSRAYQRQSLGSGRADHDRFYNWLINWLFCAPHDDEVSTGTTMMISACSSNLGRRAAHEAPPGTPPTRMTFIFCSYWFIIKAKLVRSDV